MVAVVVDAVVVLVVVVAPIVFVIAVMKVGGVCLLDLHEEWEHQ